MNDIAATMKLNHLSFPSNDIAATTHFFEQQLGCTATLLPGISMIKRPGFDIVIEQAQGFEVRWPHNFHLGFELATAADVHLLHDRFKADGIDIRTEVVRSRRGTRFFCVAPGGLLVEINTRADADADVRLTFVE
jgi:catechol 2,3-dioxygenase-like lactoylglutathione lyase family enzyme